MGIIYRKNQIYGGAPNVQSDWTESSSSSDAYILHKPTALSDFTNDTGFITATTEALTNYYKTSQTYTKTEVNSLISAIPKFKIEVVDSLLIPEPDQTTIYLLLTGDESSNLYTEYIYVYDETTSTGAFERLGTQTVDLTNYIQKTSGSKKWATNTWNTASSGIDLSRLDGDSVWKEGNNIYFSNASGTLVLDKTTNTWSEKTWTAQPMSSIYGLNVWNDGTTTYYSCYSHYVLNTATNSWETKTWNEGDASVDLSIMEGQYIWKDGSTIYFSYGTDQYVLDTATSTWSSKTWNGYTNFEGIDLWTDGENIYLSDQYAENNRHYVLDKSTSTWTAKTWNGFSGFAGTDVWTDGTNIFCSDYNWTGTQTYILDKETSTWSAYTFEDHNNVWGGAVWNVDDKYYYDYQGDHYLLQSTSGLLKNDGTVDTNTYVQTSSTAGLLKNDGTVDTTAYAKQSEMSVTDGTGVNADKTTIQLKDGTSATVLKSHQSLDGYTLNSTIAPVETGSVATQAYSEGDYFIKGDDFCTAIDDIAIGDTLTENTNYTVGQLVDSLGGDLSNYIQKSATEGLVMNDGSIDTSKHVHLQPTHIEEFQAKTWSGLSSFRGDSIWTDGDNIYYSYGSSYQYVLDKSTSTWSTKTWTGLTNFRGAYIWTDGDNIYCSTGSNHYVLDKSTSTWSAKTWNGFSGFYASYIWTDGDNIYCSNNSDQYILNKSTSTWSTKTWNGLTSFSGDCIWTDGDNIYYSRGDAQYVLDKSTSTWNTKTWNGLTSFIGQFIWTDGENVYYSYDSDQYVLNKSTSTWSSKTWTELTSFDGSKIWTDGDNIYYSNGSNQYVFVSETFYADGFVKSDGTIDTNTYLTSVDSLTSSQLTNLLLLLDGVKLVSFADGTDAEIAAMLDAYYNNKITWEQMGWQVGDTRKIHLNSMAAPNPYSSNTWDAQEITVVIVDHDHTPLATTINGHTNACITVQTREVMNNNSSGFNSTGHIYANGDSSYDATFTKWYNLYMRTYLNSTVLNAFSYSTDKGSGTSFKDMIKPSVHDLHTTYNGTGSEQVTDTLFLPSYPEIFGTVSDDYYVATSPVEGTQFSYYTTSVNRIKYGNNNGVSNGTAQTWWEGSASSYYDSYYGYRWCRVGIDGTNGSSIGNYSQGLAPAFAI